MLVERKANASLYAFEDRVQQGCCLSYLPLSFFLFSPVLSFFLFKIQLDVSGSEILSRVV